MVLKEKQSIIKETKAEIQKSTTAEDKLRTFALTINRALKKRIILFNIINSEPNDGLCLRNVFKKRYDTLELDLLRSIISFGIETGEFKDLDEEKLDYVTFISISMLRGLRLNLIVEEHTDKDPLELINYSIDLLIKALKN